MLVGNCSKEASRMDARTKDGDRATGRYVAGYVRDALENIREIKTTGIKDVDLDLRTAEAALSRVYTAAKNDPN